MKTKILPMLLILSACGTAPSPDAEPAPDAPFVATMAEAPIDEPTQDETPVDYGPAIDATPSAAAVTFAVAVNACQSANRQLCTLDQLYAAHDLNHVVFGSYWAVKEWVTGVGYRNVFVYAHGDSFEPSLMRVDEDYTRNFYCCSKGGL